MEVKQQKMVAEMCEQAMDTFNGAFKAGVKMQEEMSKWWTDMVSESSPIQDWQKRAQTIWTDAIPLAQKTAEEGMKVIDQNYRNSLDLLKKAFDTAQSDSLADAREKIQALWEASLGTLRTNAQAMVQANARAMETWSEFVRKNFDGKPEGKPAAAAKTMAAAAK